MNYQDRLKISIEGDDKTNFYSKSGILIANGYNRVAIGKRGPYIEFERKHFTSESKLTIPSDQVWRTKPTNLIYYLEFRICPEKDNIKVYFQKKVVDYADYKIGKFYISPFDLYLGKKKPIISKIRRNE
jgi:hypothetical protein